MLKQLSGMDSMFLYAESHRAPLEVGCLQVYTRPRPPVARSGSRKSSQPFKTA